MNKKRVIRWTAGFAVLLLLTAFFFILELVSGTTDLSFSEVFSALSEDDSPAHTIVAEIRLPRAASAAILGGALSVSGFLLQSFFNNPIAGPYILGVSSGAKLTVAIAMMFAMQNGIMLNSASMVGAAFIGSLLSMGAILLLSGKVRNMAQLIIAGVMIGYICSAVTELAVTFADDANIVNLHNWSMGSFSGINMDNVKVMAVIVLVTFTAAFFLSKPMSAYQLGESYAKNMGVDIKLFRLALIFLSSILSACVTAFAGPVSFVGIAVPHLIKTSFGTAKPIIVIPASFMGGAVFCLICDLIARMLFAPVELSISTITAVFGAPIVIAAMLSRRSQKRGAV
ncbi:iron ABC transporter permease [Ruminococcus sp.]|uniref:FecCD family ABC transporter permease n=1 Tax=Ruminococcus sp. TaxID=41978 RepID=UPI0025DA632D|nr:iron ABC transporter permease [Ruminococcus sp.]MCR4638105.1 iron ABC transporter permease [Ruminococcus sp.]